MTTYTTIVNVDNTDLRLKPGMTANLKVEVARKTDALRVPNAAIRFRPSVDMFAALNQPVPPEAQPGGRGGRRGGQGGGNAGAGPEAAPAGRYGRRRPRRRRTKAHARGRRQAESSAPRRGGAGRATRGGGGDNQGGRSARARCSIVSRA